MEEYTVIYKKRMPERCYGMVNVGKDGDEIWIWDKLSKHEKEYTLIHELVHARRDADDTCKTYRNMDSEELAVELETLARVNDKTLKKFGFFYELLRGLKSALTDNGKDDPDTPEGLKRITKRIDTIVAWRS